MNRFLLSALSFSVMFAASEPAMAQQKGAGGPTPVVVYAAKNTEFVDRVEAIGTLRANESIVLTSKVTETVTSINFEDGQRVQKGDILVEMTSNEQKALLDQQRALTSEASKQLERTRELIKTGAASKSLLEQRQRDFNAARAGMAALQSRLEDRIIVAPFDGIVGLRNISAGTLLQPGAPITTLDDDSTMKLDFSVPSVFLPNLKTGLEISARAAGFKETFKGTVSAIDSQINENTRAIGVRALIPNPDGLLKPGLLMTVEMYKDPRQSVTIPETAIIPEGRKNFVLVANKADDAATVEKREITIGTRRPGVVEVTKNLLAGELVVVQGTMTAQAGRPVNILAQQEDGDSLEEVINKYQPAAGAGSQKAE
jgi:membrane fusion protein (multidrug efflux system)